MKKLLILFSLLLFFSCSQEDYQIKTDLDKGELLITQSEQPPQTSLTKTSNTISHVELPENMFFENWYGGHDEDKDIEVSLQNFVNSDDGGTVKVPLELNTIYELYARGTSKHSYSTVDGDGKVINENNVIDINFYGIAEQDKKILTYDDRLMNGKIKMKIINGPILLRFEQLCPHELNTDGTHSRNPHAEYASNKSIEYFVDITFKDRLKGYQYKFNENDVNAYGNERKEYYKVIVFYHYVFVFKLDNLSDTHGTFYDFSQCGVEGDNLNNEGYYDFELPNTEKAEVRITYTKKVLKKYPCETKGNYGMTPRNYIGSTLKFFSDRHYKGDFISEDNLDNTGLTRLEKHTFYKKGDLVYVRYGHLNYLHKIYFNNYKPRRSCQYRHNLNNLVKIDDLELWNYIYNGMWRTSKKNCTNNDVINLHSDVAVFKRYKIGMRNYHPNYSTTRRKSANTNQNDIGIINQTTTQL